MTIYSLDVLLFLFGTSHIKINHCLSKVLLVSSGRHPIAKSTYYPSKTETAIQESLGRCWSRQKWAPGPLASGEGHWGDRHGSQALENTWEAIPLTNMSTEDSSLPILFSWLKELPLQSSAQAARETFKISSFCKGAAGGTVDVKVERCNVFRA